MVRKPESGVRMNFIVTPSFIDAIIFARELGLAGHDWLYCQTEEVLRGHQGTANTIYFKWSKVDIPGSYDNYLLNLAKSYGFNSAISSEQYEKNIQCCYFNLILTKTNAELFCIPDAIRRLPSQR